MGFMNKFYANYFFLSDSLRNSHKFKVREKPRRIIMGLIVNHELNLTEVRFHQLASVVDIFVILESSITSGIHHTV